MDFAERTRKSTVTLDITGIDPTDTIHDIKRSGDTLVPFRITLTYNWHPGAAIPRSIEVHVRGYFREADGFVSCMSDTAEIWRDTPSRSRAEWVARLVASETPDWWTL